MVVEAWQAADNETRQQYVREKGTFSILPFDGEADSAPHVDTRKQWSEGDPASLRAMKALKQKNGDHRVLRAMSEQFAEISAEEARQLRVPDHIVAQVNVSVRKRKAAIANLLNR